MIRQFLIAVQFLTRLPVPGSPAASDEEIGRAAALFPLVGILVGAGGAVLYAALSPFLPAAACVLAVMIYSALITGGLHEDGLADAFDGFGGGWTSQERLQIMRDSRIGTYGALALIFLILAKYNLLSLLEWSELWRSLIFAHAASRWTALPLSLWLPSARQEGQGKLVARRVGWPEAIVATLTLAAVSLLFPWPTALLMILAPVSVVVLSGLYYRSRLHGITGDCLGATNQVTEVAVYLIGVILSRVP